MHRGESSRKNKKNRGENSEPIPIDLILEILSRSSAKLVARFRLSSKFCASILLSRPDFSELFLARSFARPRLIFALQQNSKWHFYSSPRAQNPDENSSLVVATDSHMKSLRDTCSEFCGPVSGLIFFPKMRISKQNRITASVIYNPSTGQYRRLTKPMKNNLKCFLGYDPIEKRFKVLCINPSYYHDKCKNQILTLGTGKVSWRKCECQFHEPKSKGICINGAVYYFARTSSYRLIIACFDVRSEKLRILGRKSYLGSTKLVNYKGKLGLIKLKLSGFYDGWHAIKFHLWVLEDAEKQEWSKHVFFVEKAFEASGVSRRLAVVGATATGEIVFSIRYTSKPAYVFYFNPEENTLERFEIRGFEEFGSRTRVYTFADHVADHKLIT